MVREANINHRGDSAKLLQQRMRSSGDSSGGERKGV